MTFITRFISLRKQALHNAPPLLLFDYDGVIADSYEVYFREFTRACTEYGFDKLNSREAFLRLFDGNLITQLIKAGFPLHKLKKLADDFRPQMEKANSEIKPFPGMVEILRTLSIHHPVVIITANSSHVVQQFVDAHALHEIKGVLGSDIETSKVKKIRRARRQFRDHRAYYIGDTKGDMIEARRAGAIPVAAAWGWHDYERLQSAHPDYIIGRQEELLSIFEFSLESAIPPR